MPRRSKYRPKNLSTTQPSQSSKSTANEEPESPESPESPPSPVNEPSQSSKQSKSGSTSKLIKELQQMEIGQEEDDRYQVDKIAILKVFEGMTPQLIGYEHYHDECMLLQLNANLKAEPYKIFGGSRVTSFTVEGTRNGDNRDMKFYLVLSKCVSPLMMKEKADQKFNDEVTRRILAARVGEYWDLYRTICVTCQIICAAMSGKHCRSNEIFPIIWEKPAPRECELRGLMRSVQAASGKEVQFNTFIQQMNECFPGAIASLPSFPAGFPAAKAIVLSNRAGYLYITVTLGRPLHAFSIKYLAFVEQSISIQLGQARRDHFMKHTKGALAHRDWYQISQHMEVLINEMGGYARNTARLIGL